MSIKDIVDMVTQDGFGWLVIVMLAMSFIEILPIKLNPWGYVAHSLRKFFTKETELQIEKSNERIEKLEDNMTSVNEILKDLKDDRLRSEVETARLTIINAARELKKNESIDAIDIEYLSQINKKCDWYEQVCKENDISNGVAQMSIEFIREEYKKAVLQGGL